MQVREATPEDAEAVVAAHVAAIEAFGPDAYDDEQVAAWAERPDGTERYLDRLADEDAHVIVAERADEVVGFGMLKLPAADADDPETGEVVAVYVHADHAREGVGTAILAHLETTAREGGLAALELSASLNAAGFYERRGYERVRRDVHETTGGVELEVLRMRKRLDDDRGDGGK